MSSDISSHEPDLHLEITSKCALKCPACPRTQHLGEFKVTELKPETLLRTLNFDKAYKIISLCGDHGDPIYHSEFHKIIEILHHLKNSPPILIATNGSHRDELWWRQTAAILRPKDRVIFGIDGLKDTNHLYRRGSDWDSIMLAIKTLKTHGSCQVQWQWILFNYNQHQLKEGVQFARSLHVDRFYIIDSSRDHLELAPTIPFEQALREIVI